MKRMLTALLATCAVLLCCATATAETDPAIIGEWFDYGSMMISLKDIEEFEQAQEQEQNILESIWSSVSSWWVSVTGDEEEPEEAVEEYSITYTTRAHMDEERSFIVYENGTAEIIANGEVVQNAQWLWDDAKQALSLITENSDPVLFLFRDNMMYTPEIWGELLSVEVYYRPSLKQVSEEAAVENGGVLIDFMVEGERISAKEAKTDFRFSLHENGVADLLINYYPIPNALWQVDGTNIVITSPYGHVLTLEPQLDGSLFGTCVYPDGYTYNVEFLAEPPFALNHSAATLEELNGRWELTGMYDDAFFYYSREKLSFSFALELNGETAVFSMTSNGKTDSLIYSANVLPGPVLNAEEDTGTILALTDANGSQRVFWLQQNGSLVWLNPGDSSFVFEKVE